MGDKVEETGESGRAVTGSGVGNSRKCSMAIYPFFDGKLEDFDPVFTELIKVRTLF